ASPGGSDTDRSRLSYSNYGSTVDLQGWGENVYTTGYGGLYSAEGKNLWYTATFSGTSSASPIVAGACAILQSAHLSGAGSFLTPAQVKSNLQTTGSPQQAGTYPISQNIGPRPDAAAALCNALPAVDADSNWVPDLCDPFTTEACCFTNGACTDTTPANCSAYGGTSQGVGTACATTTCPTGPPNQACCLPGGGCVDTDAATCVNTYSGTPMGLGTTCATVVCASTEACCLPNGSCVDINPTTCISLYGGTPMGAGTTCATVQCPQPPVACCMPDLTCQYVPAGNCAAMGGWLTPGGVCLGDNNGIPGDDACEDGPPAFYIEFSLDIGSDIELSDPNMNGNEAADPGDVYWWKSSPIIPPGRDGFKDDLRIFINTDPWPDPPDATLTTRVPVGLGSSEDYHEYFDLDGHDQTDFTLNDAQFPMPFMPSQCVHDPKYLAVSFDDDMGPGWPALDVPVTRPSMAGVSSYGSTPGQDEIVGVTMDTTPVLPPFPIMNVYPVADEITVHQSMVPNPDGIEEHDDDVDSLDTVPDAETCPFWFFSPDHEANYGLDPGGIYEVTLAGPVQVIDEAFHLGLPEETDIDAFEFTWLENPDQPGMPFLAVLFSVDDDDPLTPLDESGGLDPTAIFVSWMTGFWMQFSDPLGDDVDAITIWRESYEPQPIGACCFSDASCTDAMTEFDCVNNNGKWQGAGSLCVTSNCCPCPGDLDGNYVVNGLDIQCFVDCLIGGGVAAGCNCDCADMQPDGLWDMADVAPFVNELLNTTICTWP
ncbi:MAG: S8 family serine peptidase, partial [Planctomycetota bacterium]